MFTSLDWVSVVAYGVIMVSIGVFFTRFMKGAKDFFAGGRMIPWWVAGVSLYMGLFSAWTFTGAAAMVYKTGWYGVMYFATWPAGFFIGFALAAKRCRRSRMTSPTEYVRTRFNGATQLTLSVLYAASLIYWPAQHLASLATLTTPILFPGQDVIAIVVVAISVIVLIYTVSGGIWAVCITDAVQSILVIGILVVLVPMCVFSGEFGSVGELFSRLPAFSISPGVESYDASFLPAYVLVGIFCAAMGDRAQRFLSVRDEKAVMKTGLLATGLFMTGPLLFGLVPLLGRAVWPDPSMIEAFGAVSNPEEGVFMAMVLRYMPPGIVGIFVAAMMAATMSATDTCWNAAAAIISVDLYKNRFRPNASEREVMNVGRIVTLFFFVAATSVALAIVIKGIKLDIIGVTIGLLAGTAVTVPLLLGLVVRRVSRWAGVGAVVFGTLAAAVASDLVHFGPLEVLGFLKYHFGARTFFLVGMTLAVFLLSRPMGRLGASRAMTLAVSSAVSVALWFFFLLANNNPALSWDAVFEGGAEPGGYFIAMTGASLLFGTLTFVFCRVYHRDSLRPEPEVDEFFRRLETPIDVEKEIGDEKESASVYPFVGIILMGLAALFLLMLAFPNGRDAPMVNIALAGLTIAVGVVLFVAGRKVGRA